MPDVTLKDAVQAVEELRKEVNEKGSQNLEKIENLQMVLDKFDEKNQEQVKQIELQKKEAEEFQQRIQTLELEVARAAVPAGKNYKETDEYKAFNAFIVHESKNLHNLEGIDLKTLRSDSDTAGGYLAPTELDNVITKKITEISNIRSIARVRTVSNKQLEMIKRSSIPTATYEGQLVAASSSESAYENETLTPYRQTFKTAISVDMLMDAAFDMEAEIISDGGEAFAKGEGTGFVSGSGVKEPEGFITNAECQANKRTSATSGVIAADDVILLTGDLKVGYDPVYVMNRRTLAQLRTLKSTDGVFLWQPGMNGPVANTINGYPYILADDMPDIASLSYSIAFGDFKRGYLITDRTGLVVIRDELKLKDEAAVEFLLRRYNTGQVVLAEAIKLLQTKA